MCQSKNGKPSAVEINRSFWFSNGLTSSPAWVTQENDPSFLAYNTAELNLHLVRLRFLSYRRIVVVPTLSKTRDEFTASKKIRVMRSDSFCRNLEERDAWIDESLEK